MEVSKTFVVLMGMGITFIGLTCIIFLTQLMGRIMQALEKKAPPQPTPAAPTSMSAPAPDPDPNAVDEAVTVAILAALMQDPAFRPENVQSIDIRRA